jgi:hypothetical protein
MMVAESIRAADAIWRSWVASETRRSKSIGVLKWMQPGKPVSGNSSGPPLTRLMMPCAPAPTHCGPTVCGPSHRSGQSMPSSGTLSITRFSDLTCTWLAQRRYLFLPPLSHLTRWTQRDCFPKGSIPRTSFNLISITAGASAGQRVGRGQLCRVAFVQHAPRPRPCLPN